MASSSDRQRHFAMFLPRRPDGYLYVLTEGCKEFHETPHRKTACSVAHEQGHVGLLDAERFSGLRLRKLAFADDSINLKRQPRFHHFLLGIWQTNVCKHIAAALSDAH